MTFLNPAWLWGLTALMVPIIVHFFNLRRPKQVLFSNVAFVKEVKKTVVRRVKFQQWLLLLLRLLAVACVVLAFARPVIQGEGQTLLQGNRSVAIVVDNSFSMQGGNEKGAYDQQAISLARNIIKAYSRQDEFLVMGTDKLRLNTNFTGQQDALLALQEITVQQHVRPHTELITLMEDLFARASNQAKELYVIGDFQKSTVVPDSQQVVTLDTSVQVSYIPLASRAQQNVYLKDHRLLSRIIQKDEPVSMSVTLVNDGDQLLNELSVRVVLEGEVVAINNTNLGPNATQELELTFTPTQAGWNAGYIEIDDNPIDFDNKRYLSFYIPDNERVLVIEDEPSPNVRILYQELFASFNAQLISKREVSSVSLEDYTGIVMVGTQGLSSGLAERFRAYLSDGGSFLLIPGQNMALSEVNNWLSSLSFGKFLPALTKEAPERAQHADLNHPVFAGIFAEKEGQQKFDAPNIFRYYPLQLNNQQIHNPIISLESGAPILLETQLENGVLYVFTIYPGDKWTDLHVKSIFAPLFYRLSQMMTQRQSHTSSQLIGGYQPVKIRTTAESLIQLVDANGNKTTPEQYIRGGGTTLNFSNMDLSAGNYELTQADQLLEKISFNISDEESQLAAYNTNSLPDKLQQVGLEEINVLPPEANQVARVIQQSQQGTPLWKYFIFATLLWLTLEIILLRIGVGRKS